MKRSIIASLALLVVTPFVAAASAPTENEYGKFVETKIKDVYAVSFVLNPRSTKFREIQEVRIEDYGNDEEGDITFVFHRNGDKEVFLRNKRNYRRYISQNSSADVCLNGWSSKIQYRQSTRKWECPGINFFVDLLIWQEIDDGLVDAKRGAWGAFSRRIIENVKKIIK